MEILNDHSTFFFLFFFGILESARFKIFDSPFPQTELRKKKKKKGNKILHRNSRSNEILLTLKSSLR